MFNKRANGPANAIIRCLYAPNLTPGPEENILIKDSAADQSVFGKGFKIMFYAGQHIQMDGAPIVYAAASVLRTRPAKNRLLLWSIKLLVIRS